MLIEAVIGTLGGSTIFGFVSGIQGKGGTITRFLVTLGVGLSALIAALLLFDHPGWDTPGLHEGGHTGKASLVLLFLALGPDPLGFLFLVYGLFALGLSRSEWHTIKGTQPGPGEGRLYGLVGLLLSPTELVRLVASGGKAIFAAQGVPVVVAALLVSAALLGVAAFSRYEITSSGFAPVVFRLDRATGEIVSCPVTSEGRVDCSPESSPKTGSAESPQQRAEWLEPSLNKKEKAEMAGLLREVDAMMAKEEASKKTGDQGQTP